MSKSLLDSGHHCLYQHKCRVAKCMYLTVPSTFATTSASNEVDKSAVLTHDRAPSRDMHPHRFRMTLWCYHSYAQP
jgi:hypothetical protein